MPVKTFHCFGEWVPARVWSCPKHEWPAEHECDCPDCDREWDCETCATARWTTPLNDDGSPVLRELDVWESLLRKV